MPGYDDGFIGTFLTDTGSPNIDEKGTCILTL